MKIGIPRFPILTPALLLTAGLFAAGCTGNQAQLDKFAADIRDLREIQAQQKAAMEEIQTDVRKLTGKLDETQNVALGRTAELEKTLEHYESRVPPPQGVPEDLLSEDEAAISRIQGDDAQLFLRALRLLRKGVFEESRDLFNQFLEKTGDNAFTDNALFWVGIASEELGQTDRAISAFSDAFRRFPAEDRVPAALFYLGESFVKIGSVNDGILAWQKLVDEHPGSKYAAKAKIRIAELKRTKPRKK